MTEDEARALVADFSMPPGFSVRLETMAEAADRIRQHLACHPTGPAAGEGYRKRLKYCEHLGSRGCWMLNVVKETIDSRHPEQEFSACGTDVLFSLPAPEELTDKIIRLAFGVELHNMAEWFKSEGQTVVDPHQPAQYARLLAIVDTVAVSGRNMP